MLIGLDLCKKKNLSVSIYFKTLNNTPLKNKGVWGFEEFSGKGLLRGVGRNRKTALTPY